MAPAWLLRSKTTGILLAMQDTFNMRNRKNDGDTACDLGFVEHATQKKVHLQVFLERCSPTLQNPSKGVCSTYMKGRRARQPFKTPQKEFVLPI